MAATSSMVFVTAASILSHMGASTPNKTVEEYQQQEGYKSMADAGQS
jgi:hypothetical protein